MYGGWLTDGENSGNIGMDWEPRFIRGFLNNGVTHYYLYGLN